MPDYPTGNPTANPTTKVRAELALKSSAKSRDCGYKNGLCQLLNTDKDNGQDNGIIGWYDEKDI